MKFSAKVSVHQTELF